MNGARIVWLDEANLVHLANGSAAISHDAAGNAYLQFEVKASDIKSGNAVVAATRTARLSGHGICGLHRRMHLTRLLLPTNKEALMSLLMRL